MKLKKNIQDRMLFLNAEKKKKITKYFGYNTLRKRKKVKKQPLLPSASRIVNICLFSGRTRGVYRGLKVSRIVLKTLYSDHTISGLKKASW